MFRVYLRPNEREFGIDYPTKKRPKPPRRASGHRSPSSAMQCAGRPYRSGRSLRPSPT